MKKKILSVSLIVVLLFVVFIGLTACDKPIEDDPSDIPHVYEPSSDYFNIYVTITTNGATARSFAFLTVQEESYRDACIVQLDPAKADETEPQFNTKDNITFVAQTKDIDTSTIPLPPANVEKLFPTGLSHHAEASGLTPGQKYFYRVGSESNDTWSEWGSFVTDDGDDTFSFMHITDSQSKDQDEFDAFEYTLKAAYDYINAPPEFIVSSGDQIESVWVPEEWNMLYRSMKDALSVTSFVPVNGNHEYFPYTMAYNFNVPYQDDGFTYYSFDYGNALVVVLDTQDVISSMSPASEKPQFIWLEDTLKNSNHKWKIVTLHKSLYSTGSHADNPDVLAFKDALVPIFGEYGVDLVLSGHDHCYARTVPVNGSGEIGDHDYSEETLDNGVVKHIYTNADGTVHVINRSVGSKFYGNSRDFNNKFLAAWDKDGKVEKPVFSMVDVKGNTLTYTSYEHDRDTGEIVIIDCFALIKP